MSSKVEIRCPNGHWVAVKISPNTKILHILEEACMKQGFQPASDYELMHGKKPLDVTLSVRFAGIPNLAKLELVKSTSSRAETNVLIALQVPTGERVQCEFDPGASVWEVLLLFETIEDGKYSGKLTVSDQEGKHPVCIYTREEIIGQFAMEQTSLRSLGLVRGKAMLRLVHREVKQEILDEIEAKINREKSRQEKISAKVAEKQAAEERMEAVKQKGQTSANKSHDGGGSCDTKPRQQPQQSESKEDRKNRTTTLLHGSDKPEQPSSSQSTGAVVTKEHFSKALSASDEARLTADQEALARSLAQSIRPELLKPHRDPEELERQRHRRIEREQQRPAIPVIHNQFADFKFPEATKGQDLYKNEWSRVEREEYQPCERETVIYSLRQTEQEEGGTGEEAMETDELPDEFFQVTESDIRMLWSDMQKKMQEEESQMLMTKSMRQAAREARLSKYQRVVVRVSFPDRLVVQGLFMIRETVHALYKFVKEFLEDKNQDFYLYTTPPKCVLKDRSATLMEAELAPMSVVYFGSEKPSDNVVSPAVLSEVSSEVEAYKVLVKYMPQKTPTTDKATSSHSQRQGGASHSRTGRAASQLAQGKVPKWFKLGKK